MADDNRDGNVIPFPGAYRPPTPPEGLPEQTLERGSLGSPCGTPARHVVVVDVHARRVQCKRCNADLDPIAVIGDMAKHFEQHAFLIGENTRLSAKRDELTEEVKRLRGERNDLRRKATKRGDHG